MTPLTTPSRHGADQNIPHKTAQPQTPITPAEARRQLGWGLMAFDRQFGAGDR